MLNAHQVVSTLPLRQTESSAFPQHPNRKGRGSREPPVWIQYLGPSPRTLRRTPHRTSPERRLFWAGVVIRMNDGRLPSRIVFGNLEGAVRRGRGGKEKVWIDCVQSDIRAFGIAGK